MCSCWQSVVTKKWFKSPFSFVTQLQVVNQRKKNLPNQTHITGLVFRLWLNENFIGTWAHKHCTLRVECTRVISMSIIQTLPVQTLYGEILNVVNRQSKKVKLFCHKKVESFYLRDVSWKTSFLHQQLGLWRLVAKLDCFTWKFN